jgi:hypothetical protein
MFQGSLPPPVLSILCDHVKHWSCQDVYIGCSGNFTIERTLAGLERFALHSNDVTIYSSVIGAHLAGTPYTLAIREEMVEPFGWLAEYLQDPADTVATLMLATRLLEGLGKTTPYHRRMQEAYHQQWPDLHAKTVQKVRDLPVSLASFYCGDVRTYLNDVPDEAGFVSFPPFWKGGYEKMWAKLEQVFTWEPPEYAPFDPGTDLEPFVERVTQRQWWALGTGDMLPGYEKLLRGKVQTTLRSKPIYLYASEGTSRLSMPSIASQSVLVPRFGPGEKLGETLTLAPLTGAQFTSLRSQYLARNIVPASPQMACAVLVDGRLIGAFGITRSDFDMQGLETPQVYLMSDFAVSPSDEPRLSKLVLHAILSHEARLLMERSYRKRVRAVTTTAFSQNPVSMKYRGVFRLLSRKDAAPDEPYRYQLNYGAEVGQWSLAEGFAIWRKKHANKNHSA